MKITELALDQIKPYKNNPRKNDQAVDAVAASIREFGFKVPIVIDGHGVIIAGHTRFKAARKLGLDKVPVVMADDLTEEQVRAFRLADNKVGELSGWKFDKLQKELDEINVDMRRFGFGDDEEETEIIETTEESSDIVTMSFQLHEKQKELIEEAMQEVADEIAETFGNTNKNGNAIYEVVRQWAAQKEREPWRSESLTLTV